MREETRILVDEIGLEEFPELEHLRFRMNRTYLLEDKICTYFISQCHHNNKLKVLDLSDNALGSKDIKNILESIEFLTLTDLDLSFNYFGREVTNQLVQMIETSKTCNEDDHHLMHSLRRIGFRNTSLTFSNADISQLFELHSLETIDVRNNTCTRPSFL